MSTHGPPPDPPFAPSTPAASEPPDVVNLLLQIRARVVNIEEVVTENQRVRDHYSTSEIAEILGKAEFTVREWCRLGRVRAEKKHSGRGKHPAWVISDAELKRIQKEGAAPGPSRTPPRPGRRTRLDPAEERGAACRRRDLLLEGDGCCGCHDLKRILGGGA